MLYYTVVVGILIPYQIQYYVQICSYNKHSSYYNYNQL